jgi:hypothetical protein
MSTQIIAAIIAFAVLFTAWVILPSRLRRRHEVKVEAENMDE